jgi:cell division protein FtsQ
MPLDFGDPDEDGTAKRKRARFPQFDEPRGAWWRPRSSLARAFFALSAMAVLAGLAVAGLMLRTYLERDSRFRIAGTEAIQATGLTEVSRAEMLPVFGEDVGRNIFFIPISERRRELEKIPWVEHATVMRLLPDRIRVSIVERKPVAFTRHGSEIGLVDGSGVLLSMPASAMARHHYSFPVLTGIDAGDSTAARATRLAVYLRLMAELNAGGRRNSEQLSEIDLTDPEDARVTMPEQGGDILAHFGDDRFLERYERYRTHIAEWKQQYPHLSSVDLRYDQQVVLEMEPGKGPGDAAPGAANSDAGQGAKPSGAHTDRAAASPKGKPAASRKTQAAPAAKAVTGRVAGNGKKGSGARKAALSTGRRKSTNKSTRQAAQSSHAAGPLVQGGG